MAAGCTGLCGDHAIVDDRHWEDAHRRSYGQGAWERADRHSRALAKRLSGLDATSTVTSIERVQFFCDAEGRQAAKGAVVGDLRTHPDRQCVEALWCWAVAWIGLVALSPWVPVVLNIQDLTGVSILLSLVALGTLPAFVLGTGLGRTRSWSVLVTSAGVSTAVLLVDFTAFGDPDVRIGNMAGYVVDLLLVILALIEAPLLGGACAGRCCRILSVDRRR